MLRRRFPYETPTGRAKAPPFVRGRFLQRVWHGFFRYYRKSERRDDLEAYWLASNSTLPEETQDLLGSKIHFLLRNEQTGDFNLLSILD
jgi:hypothetical protein